MESADLAIPQFIVALRMLRSPVYISSFTVTTGSAQSLISGMPLKRALPRLDEPMALSFCI